MACGIINLKDKFGRECGLVLRVMAFHDGVARLSIGTPLENGLFRSNAEFTFSATPQELAEQLRSAVKEIERQLLTDGPNPP